MNERVKREKDTILLLPADHQNNGVIPPATFQLPYWNVKYSHKILISVKFLIYFYVAECVCFKMALKNNILNTNNFIK